jgi:hypothetical protein
MQAHLLQTILLSLAAAVVALLVEVLVVCVALSVRLVAVVL